MVKQKEDFYNYIAQTSPYPLALSLKSAEGSYFISTEDEAYLDFTSGIAVNNLGHGLPEIREAIIQQANRHLHTMVFGEFIETPQIAYAKQLCSCLPDALNSLYYCTSGSEAVEASMKLAKRATGRTEIVSFKGAYHGSTHGALSIMGSERYKTAYRPLLPDTKQLEYNSVEQLELITDKTAGVIVEPVQAASGVTPATQQWLTALRKRCNLVGAKLIFDEVQTGFGRTGRLFAFEHYNEVPDMLVLAKSMGGGMPIGGLVANRKLMKLFSHQPILGHINTFGGNAVACAAAKAHLTYLQKNNHIIKKAEQKAYTITEALKNHAQVEQITYKGLLMAVHFSSGEKALSFIRSALNENVVLIGFLLNEKAVRLAPPLNISEDDLRYGIEQILKALDSI